MKRARTMMTWTLALLMVMPGCVPSLNPVYRDTDLVFDESVLGVWVQPESEAKWEIARRDDKSYQLIYTNEVGEQSRFVACVAEIEGTRFLDLYPDDVVPGADGFYKLHLVPIHTIYLVRSTEKNLELAAIDFDWLQEYLSDHPDAIQNALFNGQRLITAPTEDVQAFLLKHKEMFKNNMTLMRATQEIN